MCGASWIRLKCFCHCASTLKTKTFSFVFPGSGVSDWPRAPKLSSAPPTLAHQLLGAGGVPGSTGRLPCPSLYLLLFLLCPGHSPPPVRHLVQERGAQPPFSPLSHPQTPLGVEDGLQRAGRKREELCWPLSLLLVLLVQAGPCTPRLRGASPQRERFWGWRQNQQHLLPRTKTPPQVQRL